MYFFFVNDDFFLDSMQVPQQQTLNNQISIYQFQTMWPSNHSKTTHDSPPEPEE